MENAKPLGDTKGPPYAISAKAMLRKTTAELRGICQAFLMDGVVTEEEATGLYAWIKDNPQVMGDVLARGVAARVHRIFMDGIVTDEELAELRDLLREFSGDPNSPIRLPIDDPAPTIVTPGNLFCFTGKFVCGERKWCQTQVAERGGLPVASVVNSLRYLVVGSIASPAWANMNYGTKIEKAVEFRDIDKLPLSIVTEEHWLESLK